MSYSWHATWVLHAYSTYKCPPLMWSPACCAGIPYFPNPYVPNTQGTLFYDKLILLLQAPGEDTEIRQSGVQVGGSIGLFTLMTMLSFCILAPIAILKEGLCFTPGAMSAMGIADPAALMQKASIAALTFHLYQQVSYMLLARVSPVTHSVGNCIKRCAPSHSCYLVFSSLSPSTKYRRFTSVQNKAQEQR
jgi:hypothetical protein